MLNDLKNKINPTMLSVVVAAAAIIVWILDRGFITQSIAVFALLWSLLPLYKGIKPFFDIGYGRLGPSTREAVATYFPYMIVIAGTLAALGPVALGEMPVSQDHANHYYATHILVNELIPSGRFFGWTDSLGTGYPYGDTYHTPSYLLTGLLYLVTFGGIKLQASYAFGIVLAWVIPSVAVTAWARRISGPVGAVVAGLAFALDMGSDREGGWVYAMFHGVWAQHVGTGVWVLALLALVRLREKPTVRRLAVAALTAGVSMWIHPMNSITLLLGGLLLFVIYYLTSRRTAPDSDRFRLLLLVVALFFAGVIGLVWVIRMMMAGDVVYAYVAYWHPLEKLMTQLLEGALMENQLPLVSGLGLVGLLQIVVKGGRFRTYTWLLPAACILIGSMAVMLEADLGLAGGKLGIMQYRRFSVAAKPFWYAMAGAGFSAVGVALRIAFENRVASNRTAKVLLTAIAAPFLAAAITAAPGVLKSPVAMPLTLPRTGDAENLTALRKALEIEAKKCVKQGCRAVYYEKPGHGGLYPVIAMADTGFAWQPTLSLPANNFMWLNGTADIGILANRGVSVIISKWELTDDRLTEIDVFGRHHLYRIEGGRPVRVKMEGPGKAEVVSWTPSRRVIRIKGASKESELLITQPPYRKWRAEQSGKPLSISKRVVERQILSSVDGISDGELTLTFRDSNTEIVATVFGVLSMLLCLAGIPFGKREIPAILPPEISNRAAYLFGIGASALLAITPIGILIGGKVAANVEWLDGEPAGSAVKSVLHQRNPNRIQFKPKHHCVPAYVRNPKFGCSESAMRPYLTAAGKRNGKIPSCLSVGIPPKGKTTITYDLPAGTTHVKGRLHRDRLSGGTVTGRIGGRSLAKPGRRGRPFELPVSGEQNEITMTLFADKQTRACIELVAIERP